MALLKTNAQRSLEQQRIDYTPHAYDVADGLLDAVSVAAKVSMPPERVFKTLVTRGISGSVTVFVVPGDRELDLKAAARAVGEKSIEMVPVSDITPLTGYIKGGCSPIGMKKRYTTVIDQSAKGFDTIVISAGKVGLQIELSSLDLARVTGCTFAWISKQV
jgi:Cys-tRNA(Pro)/Cys-tRNA(Cys) deacylase